MTRLLALPIAFCLAGCAGTARPGPDPAPAVRVEVVREGEDWTADFRFDRPARAWAFTRSPLASDGPRPWRPQSWKVDTPGVRLERRGHYDLLVAADGGPVPAEVRITFAPFAGDVLTSYSPALAFSDGSVALYSEQFDAFPLSSAEEAARLPADLAAAALPDSRTRTTFRDAAGPLLHDGRRVAAVSLDDADGGTYLLFGPAEPIVTDAMAAVIDPRLPEWLRGALARATPEILARYAAELGPAPGPRPMVMVSWAGPTPGVARMSGSVLPGLVAMTFEGERVLREDPEARSRTLWFIAHESAHFWLGQAVRYQSPQEAWIPEGGADLLAVRAMAAVDPGFDGRAELQGEIDDCVALSAGRGVASALERNEHRAYYACGAVFALIAEAASHRPFAAFVRALVDANRADGILTRAEWLGALDRVSQDASLSLDIGRLLDGGAADPGATIGSLFRRAGVRHSVGPDGTPRLL